MCPSICDSDDPPSPSYLHPLCDLLGCRPIHQARRRRTLCARNWLALVEDHSHADPGTPAYHMCSIPPPCQWLARRRASASGICSLTSTGWRRSSYSGKRVHLVLRQATMTTTVDALFVASAQACSTYSCRKSARRIYADIAPYIQHIWVVCSVYGPRGCQQRPGMYSPYTNSHLLVRTRKADEVPRF
ncbi:hypothetical protein FA95DRAFT_1298374 [Auriscalpium vulgare]|uniref:Uncharacterized protein n=1 Tax=Auriscalpium vulgare TaxID=40419 RepID=A0ACB8R2P0_9AGAM|nr:hypothetical protein FA95DRAFT_1298374 [Auriscalpium vulgare]